MLDECALDLAASRAAFRIQHTACD